MFDPEFRVKGKSKVVVMEIAGNRLRPISSKLFTVYELGREMGTEEG